MSLKAEGDVGFSTVEVAMELLQCASKSLFFFLKHRPLFHSVTKLQVI